MTMTERGHPTRMYHLGLAISSFLLLNVLCQGFTPQAITSFSEWDHQLIFYGFAEDFFGKELGTETFITYGPALAYTLPYVTNYSPTFPWGMYGVLAFHLYCYLMWVHRLPGKSWPWIFVVVFFIFNVPALKYSPFVMLVWSFARRQDEKETSLLTLAGLIYVSWLFLFKSSWGIIGGLHLMVDAGVHSKTWAEAVKKVGFRLLGVGVVSFILYLLMTDKGTVESFWDYIRFSLEDAQAYASYNSSPLELNFISSAWSGGQEWLHVNIFGSELAKTFLAYFPVISFLGSLVLLWFSRYHPELLLVLPVLFGEYKHSYVRADITNLHGIFFLIPCTAFLILMALWDRISLRKFLLWGLGTWCLMVFLGFFPYNTPYRHPRKVWLDHLWLSSSNRELMREQSEEAFQKHLNTYEPIKSYLTGQPVLSLPARHDLSLLGVPVILPSNQPYTTTENMLRGQRDLDVLRSFPPNRIVMEDRVEKFRPGNFHEFPSLLSELLLRYEPIANWQDFTVLDLQNHNRVKVVHDLFQGNYYFNSKAMELEIPPHAFLFIQAQGTESIREKLVTTLLKSPRYSFSLSRQDGSSHSIQIGSRELRQGIALFTSVQGLFENKSQGRVNLSIKPSYEHYPNEISDELHGQKEPLTLKIQLWQFIKEDPRNDSLN